MQVHRDIDHLPLIKNAVITIGTFDGVHSGHKKVIEQLKEAACLNEGESVIVTFDPHPRMILSSPAIEDNQKGYLLNTLDEKLSLIAANGIDHVVVVPFTEAFAAQSAEHYIQKFLVEKFHPSIIIIGHDHHFGKGRGGNYKLLEACADQYGYKVQEIPKYVLNSIGISSTRIRDAILCGDLESANKFLGYDYFFTGNVVHGDKIGRTLGYPTANIKINNKYKLIPGNGIYIVEVSFNDRTYQGMMSIGVRPTVGGTTQTIEVNLFDFNDDIYGISCTVIVRKYIRPEVKFDGLDALVDQMKNDEQLSRKFFE